jgi:hypothetical protein
MMMPSAGAALVVLSNAEGMPDAGALFFMSVRRTPPPPRDSSRPRAVTADATPVPTISGPVAGDQALELLHQMQAGRVDRSRLSEDFNVFLTDEKLRGAAGRIAALGEPRRTQQLARVERGGMEVTVTRFTFPSRSVDALMYRSPDGMVQQYLLLER